MKEDAHLVTSKFGFVEDRILAYSLPAYGLNEAFDRTVALLTHTQELRESSGGILELRHPCLGSEFVQNYTCHSCFGLNGADQKNLTSQERRTEDPSLYLVGVPNWEQCKILARAAAINSSTLDQSWPTTEGDFKPRFCSENGKL